MVYFEGREKAPNIGLADNDAHVPGGSPADMRLCARGTGATISALMASLPSPDERQRPSDFSPSARPHAV